jgi:drug/metabolite transporter (DMT)-like permease
VPATRPHRPGATAALTAGALLCFAANSLLARAALGRGLADPGAYTVVRMVSGAVALAIILALMSRRPSGGSWGSALALTGYAAAFSVAYVRIPAAAGALILFPSVQASMIGLGVARGERPAARQWLGLGVALAGLAWLTLPGAEAPDATGAALMAVAGAAFGVYSVRGRGVTDPFATTAANFARGAVLAVAFGIAFAAARGVELAPSGAALATISGALASGGGYCLWYAALPGLGATRAAAVQVSVPVLAAGAAVILLDERFTARLAAAAALVVAGLALTLRTRGSAARPAAPPRLADARHGGQVHGAGSSEGRR